MYQNSALLESLKTDSTLKVKPVIAAEFNLNKASNVDTLGVYKNAANAVLPARWSGVNSSVLTAKTYTEDLLFVEHTDTSYEFEYDEQRKLDLYYDLAECLKPNRPRSGINKILYRPDFWVDDLWDADRPRYYWADPADRFKYWTSYRNYGDGVETGISENDLSIENAVPFVIYKEAVPTNKIVIKIQTNIGSGVSGSYADTVGIDPLQEDGNSSIPLQWRIEYLDANNTWNTAVQNPQISQNGYVELGYTVSAPIGYEDSFFFMGYTNNIDNVEQPTMPGVGWVVGQTTVGRGALYVWNGTDWTINPLRYGFKQQLYYDDQSSTTDQIVNPRGWIESGKFVYSDFVMVKGLRIVVDKMQNADKTFDLIEMSPRLSVDITNWVEEYSVNKVTGSDDGVIPVAGLLASVGSLRLFNGDGAFTKSNVLSGQTGSIIAENLLPNTKIYFWEEIENEGLLKYVPIKVLYVEQWPEATSPSTSISLQLRDGYSIFENEKALDALRQNMTLTGAVAWILDSVGFSNYVFVGFEDEGNDPILPFFFANSDLNLAQMLDELCKATQSMMYFDEYNNFVVASKEWVFNETRESDFTFTGMDEPDVIANIQDISSIDRPFFNSGNIRYTDRYIQREVSTLAQAGSHDKWRKWTYKPVLLWEVSPTENTRTRNGTVEMQSGFALSAITLKDDIPAVVPTVRNGVVVDNTFDAGDTAYWLARYEGYLYANGEIIKYDAIEYAVPGLDDPIVWISNNDEYQYYFSRVPFKGKIFPTGRVRIFSEPFYNDNGTLKEGAVKSHGRGMFNTPVVAHKARIRQWWLDRANTKVLKTDSSFIFNEYAYDLYRYKKFEPNLSQTGFEYNAPNTSWSISDTIKDMWAEYYVDESNNFIKDPGAIQASALVFNGLSQQMTANIKLRDTVLNTTKEQGNANFVGARVRIIGKEENGLGGKPNTALGDFSYDFQPRENANVFLSGGSCGISAFVNRSTHTGYYFEIISFSANMNDLVIDQSETDDRKAIKLTTTSGSADVTIEPASAAVEGRYINHDAFPLGTTISSVNGSTATMSTTATGTYTDVDAYVSKYIDGQARAIHNVVFYKLVPGTVNVAANGQTASWQPALVPIKLWGGLAEILVDSGGFIGQSRAGVATTPTVYDLGIEYFEVDNDTTFNLFINGKVVATVTDDRDEGTAAASKDIIDSGDYAGMFVRGSTTAIFENFMLMQPSTPAVPETSLIFGEPFAEPTDTKAINYQISPFLKASIDGLSSTTYGKYRIDYEEFGTILRECMYFNVKYDQAYPAFYSKPAPLITQVPAYYISNYRGGPYRAEFMVFNTTDKTVVLDETTGNYLRILGITFTQQNERNLNVDEYIKKLQGSYSRLYNELTASRKEYGEKAFNFESIYIQNYDNAKNLLEWLLERVRKPRSEIAIKTFFTPVIQLGDIITAQYQDDTGIYIDPSKQFVVTQIEISRSSEGPEMKIRAVER